MRRAIEVDQLQVGMYLHKLCASWLDHPFWRKSFLIEDAQTLKTIIESGIQKAVIDTQKGIDLVAQPAACTTEAASEHAEASEAKAAAPTAVLLDAAQAEERFRTARSDRSGPTLGSLAATPMVDEVRNARKLCLESKQAVQAMFEEARLGKAVHPEAALPLVQKISDSLMRNSQALISVARLKSADDYTYLHSVAVCAMMVALSRQLGLSEEQTMQAGLGGLLHDLGKACMPLEILNKPGALTSDEYQVVKQHPGDGHSMLQEAGFKDPSTLDVILHHHEKVDGSGYPNGLSGDQIGLLPRMAAVCDVYDAITSNRPYKAGWDPAESLRRMGSWKGHFDEPILRAFIRSVGIYPVGALVRLASDKLGVVTEQNPDDLLRPVVRVFYSARTRSQVMVNRLNLRESGCQDSIVGVEDPASWGFRNLERLWLD